ncbi:MAG: anthranilate phosphoribosyltransferase [Bacteroidota bacterium]
MKTILNTLFTSKHLTRTEAKNALIDIATGSVPPAQIASFMTVYLMRKISVEELAGFRDALIELVTKVDLSDFLPMDLCGTGGDNKDTFNISTLSSFIVAGAEIPIAKHGNYAVSSSCGSSNVLEYFGYRFTDSEDELKRHLERSGICFLHAPLFHPALKKVAGVRKELQVKTFFNMLGPLIHPASPEKQLLGVYSMELADLYSQLLFETNKDYCIVHSLDGFDEISLTGPYRIIERHSDTIFNPEEEGFKTIQASEIVGGTSVESSANIFIDILNGNGTTSQNSVVIANAAAAIKCYKPALSTFESIEIAKESLDSKKALLTFKNLIN